MVSVTVGGGNGDGSAGQIPKFGSSLLEVELRGGSLTDVAAPVCRQKSPARELLPDLPMYTLAERVSHTIFFWSYPSFAMVLAAGFIFWGQVDKGKVPLLLVLAVMAVANGLHWGWVRYGSWRHAFDTFMALFTIVTHEVCAIVSLPDCTDYRQLRISPIFGEPRQLGYNVLREIGSHWTEALAVCMVLNVLAAGAYLAGWWIHARCSFLPRDKAVWGGMWCHLTFRFLGTCGGVFVYAGDISGLTGAQAALGIVVLSVLYWLVHFITWWFLFDCAIKHSTPMTKESSIRGVAMMDVPGEQAV